VLNFLLQVGFDKYLGARPLNKAMEKHIRGPLARHILGQDQPAASGRMRVDANRSALVFEA
jgi:ATP-dependent Clp protease ATP-binding subunit ClpA